jgi:hypothetical protein
MASDPGSRPSADLIERLQRRRTVLMLFQGLFFVIWQVSFYSLVESGRAVDRVKIAAYLVWAVLLLAFLGTGGGWAYPRAVRAVLDDEGTVANRRQGMITGFWAAMAATLGAYAVNLWSPLSALSVMHVVLTAGVGASLLTFAFLERRAARDA